MPVYRQPTLADMMAAPARKRREYPQLIGEADAPPLSMLPPPPDGGGFTLPVGEPGAPSLARGTGGGWGSFSGGGVPGGMDPASAFVNGVPSEPFLDTIMQIESGGNPNAYNASSGATGAFQIIPSSGASPGYGVAPIDITGIKDPTRARAWARDYLAAMFRKFGTPQLAAAAYNAGPGTIENVISGRASMPAETQGYIGKAFL